MEKLKQNIDEIAKSFGYEYNDEFFSYLKSISKENKQVCNRHVAKGEGGWKCTDCELDTLMLICNDCFTKSKDVHKGHRIMFNPNSSGYCDCGDPNVLVKEGFCPDHKGPIDNQKDLMKFIKESIDENILNKINLLLEDIFLLLMEKINILSNMQSDEKEKEEEKKEEENEKNKEKEIIKNELFSMLEEFISFCSNLYKNNLGLFYFVTLKFTENYPFETNHKCFKYEEEENSITIIKENPSEKHKCICPFFQLLIYKLIENKSDFNKDTFFTLFIQNYKNKLITSISFLHSFVYLHDNDNLSIFRRMGYQLLSDQLSILVHSEKNQYFLENLFNEIYDKYKLYLDTNKKEEAEELIYNLYKIVEYLPKISLIDKYYSDIILKDSIIDIICLLNNKNVFESNLKFNEFQREGYLSDLLNCEIYSIFTLLLISNVVDYNNLENVKHIFNKIILKIKEYKAYKEKLASKTFTPHIICIKCYSIFLNRFCFNYSITNNCDLMDSFNYFQSIIPESKEINSFLFKEMINFFGFFIAQRYSFFSYYGEGMKLFYSNYFSTRVFIYVDITLMKYLLTTPEIRKDFNFDTILSYSNIDSCNDFFINLKSEDLSQINEDLSEKINVEQRNLKYINSVFEFLFLIVRENFSLFNLGFKYSDSFRMKYEDKIFADLLIKEKDNIEKIFKNQLAHFILGNKNLITRERCIKLINSFSQKLDLKIADQFLKDNCEQISMSNQLKQFSLKKSFFSFCDIDYIISSTERTNAIKYMVEFQSKNINLLNTYICNSLSIQEKLNKEVYDTFFNKNNIETIINFYKILTSNNNYPLLTDIFFYNFSKILCVYLKLYKAEDIDESIKNKLIEIFNNNKLEGNNAESIQYIKNLLIHEDSNLINDKNVKSMNKKKNLKDKFKKKFDDKNELVLKKYTSSSDFDFDLNEEENSSSQIEDICVYCRQQLNEDDYLNNYYGVICFLFSDYFINMLKSVKKKLRKKTNRFVTCKHKIHFACYSKYLIKFEDILKNGYPCPLCKKLSNVVICDFGDLLKKNKDILKGLDFDNENINDFHRESDDINKYNYFITYNKNFFEDYCSKLLKKVVLIKDINEDQNLIGQIYDLIINDFNSFVFYYNITNYKMEQINIWKNILFTIRLLCKYQIINSTDFLVSKFKSIYTNIQNLDYNFINNSELLSATNELIVSLFVLYDLNEENRQKIKNIFKNYILAYIFAYTFLKNKEKDFDEFLYKKENQSIFKKLFDLYNLEYKICFLLYDEKEEDLNLNYEETIESLKNNENIKILINKSSEITTIKPQSLEILKFHPIHLPENFMEFSSKYMNIECVYCKKKYINYEVCLICGNKVCNYIKCLGEKKSNGTADYSLIDHSKKCSGGNSIFISNKTSQIVYILKRRFINSNIYVYLNSFGEYRKDYYLNDNYLLNKVEFEKSIQQFIDLTYRKKVSKIDSINAI